MTETELFDAWRVAQANGRLAPTWAVVAPHRSFPSIIAGLRDVLAINQSDQIVVAPEEGKRTLARARLLPWLATAQLAPRGSRQLAVLISAEQLETAAATILLKVLEEPPQGTVFLLLMERDALLPTIRSRVQLRRLDYPLATIQDNELPETFSAILKWAGTAGEQTVWPQTVAAVLRASRAALATGRLSPEMAARTLALATTTSAGLNRRLQLVAALSSIAMSSI